MIFGGELRVLKASDSTAIIALAKSCTIKHQCDSVEVSPANGSTSKEYVPGRDGWTVEVSGLMSGVSDLLKVSKSYNLEIYDGSDSVYGTAICVAVQQVGTIGNLAQQTAMFQGTGPLNDSAPSQGE